MGTRSEPCKAADGYTAMTTASAGRVPSRARNLWTTAAARRSTVAHGTRNSSRWLSMYYRKSRTQVRFGSSAQPPIFSPRWRRLSSAAARVYGTPQLAVVLSPVHAQPTDSLLAASRPNFPCQPPTQANLNSSCFDMMCLEKESSTEFHTPLAPMIGHHQALI